MLATSISSYVTTASDDTFDTINTNMKSAFTKRYNSGVSAADARVNTSSASYTSGYNNGYNAGKSGGVPYIVTSGDYIALPAGCRFIVIHYGGLIQGYSSVLGTYSLGEDFGVDWYAQLCVADGNIIVTNCDAHFVIQLGVS